MYIQAMRTYSGELFIAMSEDKKDRISTKDCVVIHNCFSICNESENSIFIATAPVVSIIPLLDYISDLRTLIGFSNV